MNRIFPGQVAIVGVCYKIAPSFTLGWRQSINTSSNISFPLTYVDYETLIYKYFGYEKCRCSFCVVYHSKLLSSNFCVLCWLANCTPCLPQNPLLCVTIYFHVQISIFHTIIQIIILFAVSIALSQSLPLQPFSSSSVSSSLS